MKNLIKRCKNLERKAQREMLDVISPMLFSICLRYCNNKQDQAKDLLQESLIKIFNGMKNCRAEEEIGFRAWCKKITVHTALAEKRKKFLHIEEIESNKIMNAEEASILSKLNVDDILKLLEKIPEHHRVVFNLYVIDGYNHKEISEILSIGESSSRTFLTRAKKAMKSLIKDEWGYYKFAN